MYYELWERVELSNKSEHLFYEINRHYWTPLPKKKKNPKRRVVIYPCLIQGALIIQNKIAIDIK